MPLAELLLPEFDEEMTATRRVLERVPDGKASWKPHPKSMTLGRLATLVAELPAWAVNALTLDELDIMPSGGPPPQLAALGIGGLDERGPRGPRAAVEHREELLRAAASPQAGRAPRGARDGERGVSAGARRH